MEPQTDVAGASVQSFVPLPSLPLDTIICGDNCEVMRTMPSESIDLVVTSPPYDDLRTYGGHQWDFYGVAWNLKRLLKPGGVIVWVIGDQTKDGDESGSSWAQANHFKSIGLKLWDTMIWRKTCFSPGDGKYRYHDVFEYMFVFSKGMAKSRNMIRDVPVREGDAGLAYKKTTDRRRDQSNSRKERAKWIQPEFGVRRNVWDVTSGANDTDACAREHPAVFPEALARDHILSWSDEGDIVLDPFSGSGTTSKMAKHNGRRYIGIEVNPEYVAISEKRLAQQVLF